MKRNSDITRIGLVGRLKLIRFYGFTPTKERIYEMSCACGEIVLRNESDLKIAKLHRCGLCHVERVERIIETRQGEKSKRSWRHEQVTEPVPEPMFLEEI